MSEIEHFFVSYNMVRDREFRVIERLGPAEAVALIRAGEDRFLRSQHQAAV